MIVTYDIYRRYAERDRTNLLIPIEEDIYYGKRYELIENFKSLNITLNFSKQNKFSLKGNGIKKCPFEVGDSILIYRNAELLMTGIVKSTEIKCKDVIANSYEWDVEGVDESEIFEHRIILTDFDDSKGFQDLTFDDDTYDKCGKEGEEVYAYDRMIHYMRNCFDENLTQKGREIHGLKFPDLSEEAEIPEEYRGEKGISAYRLKALSTVLDEIGKDVNLYPQFVWDPISGQKEITIPIQRDLSGMDETKTYDVNKLIVISPEFGNVSKWSVTRTYPKFNAVWVCSGEYTEVIDVPQEKWKDPETPETEQIETRVWVYAEDEESIKKYGRIEKFISKSDVKITEDDEETEEDETVTAEDAEKLLKEEAEKQLKDNAAKEKYTITLAPTDDLEFMKHWRCGDKVKVVIDGKEFASTIETVSISFTDQTENVTPTIGKVEESIFSEVFETMSGIDKRLKVQEEQ